MAAAVVAASQIADQSMLRNFQTALSNAKHVVVLTGH